MLSNINELPAELLGKIFLEGTRTQLDEEEGAWEDEDNMLEDEEDDEDCSDIETDSSASISAKHGSRRREPSHEDDYFASTPTGEFPTLVSHVCRYWREVALNVPMLWTTLDFSEGPPYDKSRTWIERSRDCDLDITVDHTGDEEDMNPPIADLRRIMQLIAPHVHRWRIIHISVSSKMQMRMVLRDFLYQFGPAPRLRSLSLYDNSSPEDDSEPEIYDESPLEGMIFSDCVPLLNEATFWGVGLQWKKATFLRSLENLELAYHDASTQPSWEDFASLLLASPNLKVLSIADSGPDPEDDLTIQWPEDPIQLLSLHRLSISFVPPIYVAELISRLDIPSLEELELDLEGSGEMEALVSKLTGRKKNVLKNLRKLKIGSLESTPPEVIVLYSSLTSLHSLRLNLNYLNPSFITLLYEESMYLPQLEELTILGLDDHMDDLKEVIIKRTDANIGIKKLVLCNQDTIEDENLEWFRNHVGSLELIDNYEDEEVSDTDSEIEGMTLGMIVEGMDHDF